MRYFHRRREAERYEPGLNWQSYNGRNVWMGRLVWFWERADRATKYAAVLTVQKRRWWIPYFHAFRAVRPSH